MLFELCGYLQAFSRSLCILRLGLQLGRGGLDLSGLRICRPNHTLDTVEPICQNLTRLFCTSTDLDLGIIYR